MDHKTLHVCLGICFLALLVLPGSPVAAQDPAPNDDLHINSVGITSGELPAPLPRMPDTVDMRNLTLPIVSMENWPSTATNREVVYTIIETRLSDARQTLNQQYVSARTTVAAVRSVTRRITDFVGDPQAAIVSHSESQSFTVTAMAQEMGASVTQAVSYARALGPLGLDLIFVFIGLGWIMFVNFFGLVIGAIAWFIRILGKVLDAAWKMLMLLSNLLKLLPFLVFVFVWMFPSTVAAQSSIIVCVAASSHASRVLTVTENGVGVSPSGACPSGYTGYTVTAGSNVQIVTSYNADNSNWQGGYVRIISSGDQTAQLIYRLRLDTVGATAVRTEIWNWAGVLTQISGTPQSMCYPDCSSYGTGTFADNRIYGQAVTFSFSQTSIQKRATFTFYLYITDDDATPTPTPTPTMTPTPTPSGPTPTPTPIPQDVVEVYVVNRDGLPALAGTLGCVSGDTPIDPDEDYTWAVECSNCQHVTCSWNRGTEISIGAYAVDTNAVEFVALSPDESSDYGNVEILGETRLWGMWYDIPVITAHVITFTVDTEEVYLTPELPTPIPTLTPRPTPTPPGTPDIGEGWDEYGGSFSLHRREMSGSGILPDFGGTISQWLFYARKTVEMINAGNLLYVVGGILLASLVVSWVIDQVKNPR